ncbi:MAG: dockerin type I repeat-containing protein [Oscillospiraceae bacterium]|nr:dockerin type I repeat-containing protein [Oscillospiraceae bacterium]
MKRPLRKLIAFSFAAALLANVTVLNANAAYQAEPVSETDFDSMIEYTDRNVYINSSSSEATELVIIGKDGSKQTVKLDKRIRSIAPAYRAYGGTVSAYGYNLSDPAVALALDQSNVMIGQYALGDAKKYALVNAKTGEQISEMYDEINIITDNLFAVCMKQTGSDGKEHYLGGVIDAIGKPIFKLDESYGGFYLTKDRQHLLVDTKDGDYFTDLKGNPVSEKYPEITVMEAINNGSSHGFMSTYTPASTDYRFNAFNCGSLDYDIYRFRNADGQYALAFKGMAPETKYAALAAVCARYIWEGYTARKIYYAITLSSGTADKAEYYGFDGKKLDRFDTLRELTLTDEDGTEHKYLYANENSAFVCDTDEKLLIEGDGWGAVGKESVVLRKDGQYLLYNAKMELVDTFASWTTVASGYYAKKGSNYIEFDKDLHILNEKVSDAVLKKLQVPKTALFTDSETPCYLVKDEEKPFTWQIWDSIFQVRNTITLEPKHGGQLVSGSETVNKYSDSSRSLAVHANEIVEDAEGNVKNYSQTYYLFMNCDYDFYESDSSVDVKTGGSYFLISGSDKSAPQLVDASGRNVLPAEYQDIVLYTENDKGKTKYYYVCSTDTDFTVYNDDAEALYTIKGKALNENIYEVNGKYGFYLVSAGARTNASYTSAYEDGMVRYMTEVTDYFNKTPLRERIYPMTDGKKLYFCDGFGNLYRSFESNYRFPGGTQSVYDLGSLILNDRTADGKSRTYIYDATKNEIKYQQTGIYDRVLRGAGDYAVTVNEPKEEGALWTSDIELAQGLIRADGTVLIAPTKGLNITLSRYCFNGASGGSYSGKAIDTAYDNRGTYDITEIEGVDYYAVLNTHTPSATNDSEGFYVPVKDLAPEFAAKYGYAAAVRTQYDCYVVFKDGKWGLADITGKALCDPTYDWICQFKDGLAWTITYTEEEYLQTVRTYDPEKDEYVSNTVKAKRYVPHEGIIDMNGKAVAAPVLEGTGGYSLMISGDAFCLTYDHGGTAGVYTYDRTVFRAEDHFNKFAVRYGYQTAVKSGGLYLVMKDGKYGVADENNTLLVPAEFPEVVAFTADEHSMRNLNEEEKALLSTARFTNPISTLSNGTKTVTFKTAEGKIRAYLLTDDGKEVTVKPTETPMGDINCDGKVTISDAVLMMRTISEKDLRPFEQPTQEGMSVADVDEDGYLTIMDVCELLKILAGLRK